MAYFCYLSTCLRILWFQSDLPCLIDNVCGPSTSSQFRFVGVDPCCPSVTPQTTSRCLIDILSSSTTPLLVIQGPLLTSSSSPISVVSIWSKKRVTGVDLCQFEIGIWYFNMSQLSCFGKPKFKDGQHVDSAHCSASSQFRRRLHLLAPKQGKSRYISPACPSYKYQIDKELLSIHS